MAFLLYAYIGLYTVFALWGMRQDLRWGVPRWKALVSTVGNALGIAGMLLFALEIRDARIATVWAGVCALLAVQLIVEGQYEFRHRLRRLLPEGVPADDQTKSLVWTSLALGLVSALPYYWMNLQLALGKSGG
ncbi:MAG: hypothetical protein ACYS26_16555 [Planctomycetota bacterium]|jgi:hypothetical protein